MPGPPLAVNEAPAPPSWDGSNETFTVAESPGASVVAVGVPKLKLVAACPCSGENDRLSGERWLMLEMVSVSDWNLLTSTSPKSIGLGATLSPCATPTPLSSKSTVSVPGAS